MTDICVCCGRYVPEGRMVCPICQAKYLAPQEEETINREEGHL